MDIKRRILEDMAVELSDEFDLKRFSAFSTASACWPLNCVQRPQNYGKGFKKFRS